MASSRRAWLYDTPNSTLAGRRYLLELFVDPGGLRLLVPPDRSFRLSGPLRFPPAPRPQVRHAFDGHPPPAGGTGYPLSRRDRVSSGYPAARVRVAQSWRGPDWVERGISASSARCLAASGITRTARRRVGRGRHPRPAANKGVAAPRVRGWHTPRFGTRR